MNGGITNIIDRMRKEAEKEAKSYGYEKSEAYRFMPGVNEVVQIMNEEKSQQQYEEQFKLPSTEKRNYTIIQLFNSALEMKRGNTMVDINSLVSYATRRGGTEINVGGNNPYVEEVDVQGAINLANSIQNGSVKTADMESVGGAIKIINRMSMDAKKKATEFGYNDVGKAGIRFLGNPSDIIKEMPERSTNDRTH